jgi:hypothetical protein
VRLVAEKTGIDGEIFKAAINEIADLVTADMLTNFQRLTKFNLQAGHPDFDAAQWLEDRLVDRRHGLIAHVENMDSVFQSLAKTLKTVAETISEQDSANGNSVENGAVVAINEWVTEVKDYDLDPAIGGGHTLTNKKNYDNPDHNKGDRDPYTGYKIGPDGKAITNENGEVVTAVPKPEDVSVPGLVDEYGNVIDDANSDAAARPLHDEDNQINEDYVFLSDPTLVTDIDPEDRTRDGEPSGGQGSNGSGEVQNTENVTSYGNSPPEDDDHKTSGGGRGIGKPE